ncbi:MAG TPA: hypothetical protein VK327_05715 [Candidatus Paceibacterota bacterium]|nr:hypothetical protein [Candidatus Paceibacterota bacterium]
MIKTTLKSGLFCLLAAALVAGPATLNAQETNKHAEKKVTREKAGKSGVVPFHGKLKAVDKTAKTVTFGETTVQVTSETKITKDGKPATFDDAVVGENVGGAYKKGDDGKLNAVSLRIGAKPETAHEGEVVKEKKKKKDQ